MSKERSSYQPFDEMIRNSKNLWHVHSDAKGVKALTTSTKPLTREDIEASYRIPLQRRERGEDGRWTQVEYRWSEDEIARKAALMFPERQREAAA